MNEQEELQDLIDARLAEFVRLLCERLDREESPSVVVNADVPAG